MEVIKENSHSYHGSQRVKITHIYFFTLCQHSCIFTKRGPLHPHSDHKEKALNWSVSAKADLLTIAQSKHQPSEHPSHLLRLWTGIYKAKSKAQITTLLGKVLVRWPEYEILHLAQPLCIQSFKQSFKSAM